MNENLRKFLIVLLSAGIFFCVVTFAFLVVNTMGEQILSYCDSTNFTGHVHGAVELNCSELSNVSKVEL